MYNTIGQRLRAVRKLLNLTLDQLGKKTDYHFSSIQRFETSTELDIKIIHNLLNHFQEFGVDIDKEWLINGIGPEPQLKKLYSHNFIHTSSSYISDEQNILQEIAFFESNYKHFKYIYLHDASMEPKYCNGDYIGGFLFDSKNISKYHNKDCVLYTSTGVVIGTIIIHDNTIISIPFNRNFKSSSCEYPEINQFFHITWHRIIDSQL